MNTRTKVRRELRDLHILKYTNIKEFDKITSTLDIVKELAKPQDYDYFVDNCIYGKGYNDLKQKYGNKSKPTYYKHINKALDLFIAIYNVGPEKAEGGIYEN